MSKTLFKDSSYNLQSIISKIQLGEIGLPDIQRPFVWSNAKVRDLFDSMYKGFPVGYLLFWATGADSRSKKIGVDEKQSAPSLLIVDGQQRLTSLFAVVTGANVVKKDYSSGSIKVAFKPSEEKFEVTDAAIERDPEFISDISEVYRGSFHSFVSSFLKRLEEHRGETLEESESNRIADNLDRLRDLQSYPFQAIELDRTVDEERVAEIFVRINSEGVQLNTSDFILTLMSVFWEEGRIELEDFCRAAKAPSQNNNPSPFNYHIEPSPDQLLRASLGLAFRRARMQPIYSILRGKDLESGRFDEDRRNQQFGRLAEAQKNVLDLNHWHEFLKCLSLAGFRSARMITSDNAVMLTYLIWLIGKVDFKLPSSRLREVIPQWWFMVHTTARYTGSTESIAEYDLNKIKAIPPSDGEAFCETLIELIRENLTEDFWNITFPSRIDSASAKNPRLSAYWAALNILDAEVLFSNVKVGQLLDPAITPVRDMERHHLFPRSFLKSEGVSERYLRDQIANMAFVDWVENLEISESAPSAYWDQMTRGLSGEKLSRQMYWHALPENWEQMNYEDFLKVRRHLIAQVAKDGFQALCREEDSNSALKLEERINKGESDVLEFKESARWSFNTDQKKKSELIIVKTIAGFLNRNGGSLFIGVKDDGSTVGLQPDYKTMSKGDRDGYELFLSQLISDSISGPANTMCKVIFHDVDGVDVCEVRVTASPSPVFCSSIKDKNHTDFWLREGNRTVQYQGAERQEYIDNHWR